MDKQPKQVNPFAVGGFALLLLALIPMVLQGLVNFFIFDALGD
jgi:hypothetical protein